MLRGGFPSSGTAVLTVFLKKHQKNNNKHDVPLLKRGEGDFTNSSKAAASKTAYSLSLTIKKSASSAAPSSPRTAVITIMGSSPKLRSMKLCKPCTKFNRKCKLTIVEKSSERDTKYYTSKHT